MRTNHTPEFVLLYHTLQLRRENGESWESIAKSFGSPKIARGYIYNMIKRNSEPEHNHIREALGLPALVPVPACPVPGCDEAYVHLHGQATYNPTTQHLTPNRPKRVRTPRNYEGKAWLF